ncbi:MAG: ArsR family transcriptional regulator [Candidatus Lokiarchaeota archaeon]|nr:ArsR family transcriptional regulator [Candidatus Lokiarchaeota archaeon]MBD3201382.1 ArsR family transcriptional regulator [Candidatus Lokiarchaeota archaeon]
MKNSWDINEALACLKSEKRVNILKLLLESETGLYFNEIAEKLTIIPSTLEYHLKHLVKVNLISHSDKVYLKNAYSQLIWNTYENLSNLNPVIPFLKTHKIPFNDTNLLLKFVASNPVLIPDLISMLKMMKNLIKIKISKFRIAGSFNLELEEKVMRFDSYDIRMDKLEIISSYKSYQKLLSYNNFEYFFSFTKLEDIKLFLVKECNFYMGIGENMEDTFGILFLPDFSDEIDFQKALLFRSKNNTIWLHEKFESLKKKAKRINLTEALIENKALFSKYLDELNHK